jgi:transcriptional regulator with XRE-family HTH domain
MLRQGWKQLDLARAAGLSPETVRPFTTGKPANRDPASMAKIAIALGAPGDTIVRILDGDTPDSAPSTLEDRISLLEDQIRELRHLIVEGDTTGDERA